MKTKTFNATLLAIALAFGLFHLNAQTYTFTPSDDATIHQKNPNGNSGESTNMTIRNSYGGTDPLYWGRDGLVNFDINALPATAEILSAKLNLYYHYYWDNNPAGRPLKCYRIAESWEEMTVTWNTQPAYFPQPTATAIVPNTQGKWMTWDVTADVQDIVSNPDAVNYGWKITDEQYWGWVNIPITYFYTKESDSFIPYLEIEKAPAAPPQWEVIGGTQYSMTLLADISFGAEPFVAVGDNMAAAFGPGGEDDCRALGAGQDGLWMFTIVSSAENQDEEVINFKLYNETTATIYVCNETIMFEDNAIIGTPENPFQLTVTIYDQQQFSLHENWNWISFNIHTENPGIESVFGVLGDAIHQVKNQARASTWHGSVHGWMGDLLHISDGEGYLVKMHSAVEDFVINGAFIDLLTPVQLAAGWNWIGYFPQDDMPVEDALASVTPNAVQIKGQYASATWYDDTGWIGDLLVMEPGKGYKINMNADGLLIYPSPVKDNGNDGSPDEKFDITAAGYRMISGTSKNMVIIAMLENAPEFAALAAWDANDRCVSIAKPFVYGGEALYYFTVAGNENGNILSFSIIEDEHGKMISCREKVAFSDNLTMGSPRQPFKLTFDADGATDPDIPKKFELLQNHPNPFNQTTNISYILAADARVKITVYDYLGKKVKTIVDKDQPAGKNTVILEKGLLQPGIYFFRMKAINGAGAYEKARKMVIR